MAQLENEGASAVVSFGGQANSELALKCTDAAKLSAAYESVIKRYALTTIDLDIEGPALDDAASIVRRAKAIAALQKSARAAKEPLNVWLTLPVEPNGLQSNALKVVRQTMKAGVAISGVNVMAMDFTADPEGDVPGHHQRAFRDAPPVHGATAAAGPGAHPGTGLEPDGCDRDDRPERRGGADPDHRRRQEGGRVREQPAPGARLDVVAEP